MARISVVVPVFNQVALTRRCLDSLLANSRLARELVVVDNASVDETPQVLQDYEEKFRAQGWAMRVVRLDPNVGFGRACNRGVRECTGERVAILSNDTWVMPVWDGILYRRLEELSADMVGPWYDEEPYHEVLTPARIQAFIKRNRGKYSRDWVSMLMFFNRQSFEKIGFFDERFFLTYEDADLRERMDRAGMTYFQIADCAIWHKSKGTRGSGSESLAYEQEGLRLFLEKWGFDPRERERTRWARLGRRWKKIKRALGRF